MSLFKKPHITLLFKRTELTLKKKKKKTLIKLKKEACKETGSSVKICQKIPVTNYSPFFLSLLMFLGRNPNLAIFQWHLFQQEFSRQSVGAAFFQNGDRWTLAPKRCQFLPPRRVLSPTPFLSWKLLSLSWFGSPSPDPRVLEQELLNFLIFFLHTFFFLTFGGFGPVLNLLSHVLVLLPFWQPAFSLYLSLFATPSPMLPLKAQTGGSSAETVLMRRRRRTCKEAEQKG